MRGNPEATFCSF